MLLKWRYTPYTKPNYLCLHAMYFNYSGSFDETGSPDVNDGLPPLERDDSSYIPSMAILHKYGKEIELPTFEDPLVRRALEDVKPPSRHTWSKIITRCAYHLLSKGVPRKHDYQMFAESFYRRYPCVGTSRGPNPWVCIVTLREQVKGEGEG